MKSAMSSLPFLFGRNQSCSLFLFDELISKLTHASKFTKHPCASILFVVFFNFFFSQKLLNIFFYDYLYTYLIASFDRFLRLIQTPLALFQGEVVIIYMHRFREQHYSVTSVRNVYSKASVYMQ